MMHTEFRSGDQARAKILEGVTQVANALRVTLGPRSRSVLIGKSWGTPEVCDDGATIARTISLKDPVENIGAQIVRQAALRTGDAVDLCRRYGEIARAHTATRPPSAMNIDPAQPFDGS